MGQSGGTGPGGPQHSGVTPPNQELNEELKGRDWKVVIKEKVKKWKWSLLTQPVCMVCVKYCTVPCNNEQVWGLHRGPTG